MVFPRRGSLSMGLEGGLGKGLLKLAFDVHDFLYMSQYYKDDCFVYVSVL